MKAAADRYRYFRIEARELLDSLGRGILELEKRPADRSVVALVLRHAHTLKGAARIVQQGAIGEAAHAIEDALAPYREPSSPEMPRAVADELLRLVDEIAAALAALAPASAPTQPTATAPDEAASVRPEASDVERLFDAVLEAGVQAAAVRSQLGRLEHATQVARVLAEQLQAPRIDATAPAPMARLRSLADDLHRTLVATEHALAAGVHQTSREIADVRDAADRLRLVPSRALLGPLERVARDAARALDREVEFGLRGGDVRLDAGVLSQLRGALQHVVRNAVTHGIEPPAERALAGKPRAGRVWLEVERRGSRIAFACRDDGRGVDVEAVRALALRKGRIGVEEASRMSSEEVAALVLHGGLSTVETVTEVSGRGVGLDVLRDTAARLRAEVHLGTEPGRGTTVEIAVPVSLASLSALHLEASATPASLPLGAVRETVFVPSERLTRTAEGTALAHRGRLIPFVPLPAVLGLEPPARERRSWSAVLVEADGALAALGADRLLGTSEVVMHPLPEFLAADPAIAGAFLDAEGNPRLVLDAAGVLAAVARARPVEAAPRERHAVLVVDDSLTTRMLEQSILESAGYDVELAVSGEEALEKCRGRRFGLFLVDIEMPGMDGFEFVRITRADPQLRNVPAILVTSRTSAEDRRRGAEVGAADYMVKSEFDQGRLLGAIRELMG